jgi:hypothetical protein
MDPSILPRDAAAPRDPKTVLQQIFLAYQHFKNLDQKEHV